jgi:uncharacterized protein YigE (DUF2233 family)
MSYKFLKIFFIFFCYSFLVACKNIDTATKKEIKKETKKIAKQIGGTFNNLAATKDFISFEADPNKVAIKTFWKDDKGTILGSLGALKSYVSSHGDSLLFACNGGMYMQDQSPLGALVINNTWIKKYNLNGGNGNFYLKPKGVFYMHRTLPVIASIETDNDLDGIIANKVSSLTQSGPMLIHDGVINTLFTQGSANLNIRNGVGILPNGHVYFAMSAMPINFFDFAMHFKNLGCKEALYLDGFVSRCYAPSENFIQTDGAFGVMIGVVKKHK